jgi:hypothetical protein
LTPSPSLSELLEFKAREKEINAKEKELVRSQQILSRQQQTDETLQIHSHLNALEAKLRQVTQEKADLAAQLKSATGGGNGSGGSSPMKNKFPRSNSMPIPSPVTASAARASLSTKEETPTEEPAEGNGDEAIALINELTQK